MSLKNISDEPVILHWDGVAYELKPKQVCRFQDDGIELHFKQKYPNILEYKPEDRSKSRQIFEVVETSEKEEEAKEENGSESSLRSYERFRCPYSNCDFVGINEHGLRVHIARHR
jgi:hypothetical protein